MATIDDALRTGSLEEFILPQYDGRLPLRRLLVAKQLFDWIDGTEALHAKQWAKNWGRRTRYEHLEQTFADFRCEKRPLVGDLNRLTPNGKGLWKMHSPGLRIFGWVPRVHEFVAVSCAFNEDTHGENSAVKSHMDAVEKFIKSNGLTGTILRGDRSALFPPPGE